MGLPTLALMHVDDVLCLTGPLEWRDLDGEWIAYQASSGAMGQFDALAVSLLTLLEDSSGSAATLLARLEAETEALPDSVLGDAVGLALKSLVEGHFIRVLGGEPAW